MARKLKHIALLACSGLVFAALLPSCTGTSSLEPSSSQESSSQPGEESSTSPDEGTSSKDPVYASAIGASDYGYVLPSVAQAAVGAEVTYTVYSNDESLYDPVAIVVNDVEHELDADNSFTTTMAEGGNEVSPVFQAILEDFSVTPEYYSITVEKIPGALYRLNDKEWQESNVFADQPNDPENRIVPHLTYQVSVMIAEDDTLRASQIVTKEVTTVPERETVLDKLRAMDFALRGTIDLNYTFQGNPLYSTECQVESALTADRWTINVSGSEVGSFSEEYVAGEHGLLAQEAVNYNNEVETQPVDNSTTFASQFFNPFTAITADEVSLNADKTALEVQIDNIQFPYTFPVLLIGDSTLSIDYVRVLLDDNLDPTGIEMNCYTYLVVNNQSVRNDFVYSASFVDADTVASKLVQPYEHVEEHDALQELFTELAKQNYTVEVEDSNLGKTTIYSTENQALFENEDGTASGIVQVEGENGGFARYDVATDGETKYMQGWEGYPMAGRYISEFQRPFDYAAEVFEYDSESGQFHLRSTTYLYREVNHILPDSLNVDSSGYAFTDMGSVYVELTEDGAIFTYTYTDWVNEQTGAVKATVTNIGTTEIEAMDFVPYSAAEGE